MIKRTILLSLNGLFAFAFLITWSSPGQRQVMAQPALARPIVRSATRFDTSIPLSKMQPIPSNSIYVGETIDLPSGRRPVLDGNANPTAPDPVLQGQIAGLSAAVIEANFEGVINLDNDLLLSPPDTEGDVGPNHYVQMVNLSFAIWDKSGNLLYGPVNNNTLWQGFGGPCEYTNDGDPIVLYDHLADRWLMSQFALPNYPSGPYYQCIAISQTPDPTGAWHRYEFLFSNSKLNDYPKFGVWPDGYYMTANQYSPDGGGLNWAGQGVVAYEREQMLSGGTARMVYFDLEAENPDLGGMLPADLDGPAPPPDSPNPFVQVDDDAWGYAADQLEVWNFHVDWSNPANSTFTFDSNLATAAFDSNLCNYARNCIRQPGGGSRLDAISDLLMYRLQYRNFGAYMTLVVNHTVDVDGNDHAGIRWYELRDTGGGWDIYQQGTFAPDSDHRWMGSTAMNGVGDIALGYSVSSSNTYPSIRFTGRLDGDDSGLMTVAETEIIAGSASQYASNRWGDYSTMSVDPVDDCTFWYTQEYYATTFRWAPLWQTRIGSFKLAECDFRPTVNITSPADGSSVSGIINVTADASDDNGLTQVEFFVDNNSIGVDEEAPFEISWDTNNIENGPHIVSATATDSIGQMGSDSISTTVGNPTAVTITDFTATAEREHIRLSWETAVEVDLIGFNLYRSIAIDGEKELLNSNPIPVKSPGELVGESYEFFDESVQPGVLYDYWLQPVKVGGLAEVIGPIHAKAQHTICLPLIKASK